MASLLSNTRHFAKLLSCRGFSTALSRPLTPGRSMAIKSGNGFKIGQRRYCTNKVELAKKQETSPSKDVKEHSVGVGKFILHISRTNKLFSLKPDNKVTVT